MAETFASMDERGVPTPDEFEPPDVPTTTEPPVPFPDHDIDTVAAITGALAALATGNPELRQQALDTLRVDLPEWEDDRHATEMEWAAALADTVTWLLAVHGVEPDQLWAAYFALSERITGTGEGT